jgi:hypothetical protein
VTDYFAAEAPAAPEPPAAAPAPVEDPAPTIELNTIPLAPPAPAPAEEPEPVGLPTMAPAAPEPLPEPAAAAPVELPMMAPQPSVAPTPTPEPDPEPATAPEPAAAPEPVEPALPVLELAAVVETTPAPAPELEPAAVVETAPAPAPAPELEELFAPMPQQQSAFSVVVRLTDGDGVLVGSFRDFGTAMEGAQEVIEQFSTAAEGQVAVLRRPLHSSRPHRLGRRGRGERALGRPADVDRHHRAHGRVPAPRLLVDDLADLAPVAHRLP